MSYVRLAISPSGSRWALRMTPLSHHLVQHVLSQSFMSFALCTSHPELWPGRCDLREATHSAFHLRQSDDRHTRALPLDKCHHRCWPWVWWECECSLIRLKARLGYRWATSQLWLAPRTSLTQRSGQCIEGCREANLPRTHSSLSLTLSSQF